MKNYIDLWYGDKHKPKKYAADAFFNDTDGTYYGNIYTDEGKIIGDYHAQTWEYADRNFRINWNQ